MESATDKYLEMIAHYLSGRKNASWDFSKPRVRSTVSGIYPFFIFMYALLIVAGVLMNCAMLYHIVKHRLYRDPTYAFLINIIITNFIKSVFALPISLAVLLIENWIFGKFICFFLPMLQDIPFHVSMMTHLMIAVDRYRALSDPGRPRVPAFVCSLGSWFFAVCIVLPYPVYMTYVDLEKYTKPYFKGLGICVVNLEDDMQQYMRGLFIGTYVAPLTITAYLYVKASRELQRQEGSLSLPMYEARSTDSYSRHGSNVSNDVTSTREGKRDNAPGGIGGSVGLSRFSMSHTLYDTELDIRKEKRTQKYLVFMVTAFATCMCPLMILRLAKLALIETYENGKHFDITYTIFVWVAFVPTITTPGIYSLWQMSRSTKERLQGYFRVSSRRLVREAERTRSNSVETPTKRKAQRSAISYTQHFRANSLTGSNSEGSSRGSVILPSSPNLPTNNVHRMSLVQ
ncbi:prolactin-releasing peptide receptor [Prorops nasuta]|uniref:prolactin-releasing peptide receptor n=1 Tax=Prorops nasuta TaxID=863751 RepID=UPI0034CDF7E3